MERLWRLLWTSILTNTVTQSLSILHICHALMLANQSGLAIFHWRYVNASCSYELLSCFLLILCQQTDFASALVLTYLSSLYCSFSPLFLFNAIQRHCLLRREHLWLKSRRQKPQKRIRVVTDVSSHSNLNACFDRFSCFDHNSSSIWQAVKNYRYDDDPVLAACGISIEKQLTQVDGCVLEEPKVVKEYILIYELANIFIHIY